MKSESKELYDKVILQDYCIGCGACCVIEDSPFDIEMNQYGNIVARPKNDPDKSHAEVLEICPFSGYSKNEDELSSLFFPNVPGEDKRIGKYLVNFAGHVKKGEYRKRGSSGGIGKWLGDTLLKDNLIDYLIQVVPNQTNDPTAPLFDYQVFRKNDKVLVGSKSSYYPVHLVDVIKTIRKNKGRYAVNGVPCFIKALRLLSLKERILNERIKYTIGIICGGMKSANQAKMIGWQLGVKPENLIAIDFRRKYEDKPAKYKIYQVWSNKDNTERYMDSFKIFGTDWGSGYFKPNACDYCDDVVAETADISVGDAWLPGFEEDPEGNSIVVVRNTELLELIQRYLNNGCLGLKEMTAEDVAKSQAGGLRHRREGLSYRISKKEKNKLWYPPKRIKANDFKLTRKRKHLFDLREKITSKSHLAFYNALKKNDLNIFFREMKSLYRKYHSALYGKIYIRAFNKARRIFSNAFKKSR